MSLLPSRIENLKAPATQGSYVDRSPRALPVYVCIRTATRKHLQEKYRLRGLLSVFVKLVTSAGCSATLVRETSTYGSPSSPLRCACSFCMSSTQIVQPVNFSCTMCVEGHEGLFVVDTASLSACVRAALLGERMYAASAQTGAVGAAASPAGWISDSHACRTC